MKKILFIIIISIISSIPVQANEVNINKIDKEYKENKIYYQNINSEENINLYDKKIKNYKSIGIIGIVFTGLGVVCFGIGLAAFFYHRYTLSYEYGGLKEQPITFQITGIALIATGGIFIVIGVPLIIVGFVIAWKTKNKISIIQELEDKQYNLGLMIRI